MSTMNCPNCNTTSPAGAIFCDNCGYDLRNAVPARPPTPPTVATPSAGPQAGPASGEIRCQSCGHNNVAGSAFCEQCGSQLQQPHPATPAYTPPGNEYQSAPPVQETYEKPIVTPSMPRLVIQGSNTVLQITPGKQEIVLGREDPVSNIFPDIDLDPHGGQDAGVGRMHARISMTGGQTYIEDLNSVNHTWVNKQIIPANQKVLLNNGDEIRLGLLVLNYYSS